MKKQEIEYRVEKNGVPDFTTIPLVTLSPIAKKFLENILKKINDEDKGE